MIDWHLKGGTEPLTWGPQVVSGLSSLAGQLSGVRSAVSVAGIGAETQEQRGFS